MKQLRRGPFTAVAVIALIALAVPLLPLQDPLRVNAAHQLLAPSWAHPLGEDEYGRDVLSRLLWGTQTSLSIAAVSVCVACVFGTMVGLIAGFLRRPAEYRTARDVHKALCFPPMVFALLIVGTFGPGASTLIPLLAVVYLPGFTRVVYTQAVSVLAMDHAQTSRALGAAPSRIMWRIVVPNITRPVWLHFGLTVTAALVLESGLSFLGLGLVPPALSLGQIIGESRTIMTQAPLLLLLPCAALSLTVLAMNMVCDAMREAVDPHTSPALEHRRAAPIVSRNDPQPTGTAVVDVRNLTVEMETLNGSIYPVRDVSFSVRAGETLAIVGESGSGKSLTGLAMLGLLPPSARVSHGSVWLQGRNLLRVDHVAMGRLLGGPMAMIFQNSLDGLNPVQRVGIQVTETLRAHWEMSRDEAMEEAIALLGRVGMADPERQARAFPRELSSSMRQRAIIAIAIANDPRLLIADEPTGALDSTTQMQLLDLLNDLRRELGMALVFISHSMPVAAEIADRLLVMYAGEVVEQGAAHEVLAAPLHPYTAALLAAAPNKGGGLPHGIAGSAPQPHALPPGCAFAPRCAFRLSACEARRPDLVEVTAGRATRCLRWAELA